MTCGFTPVQGEFKWLFHYPWHYINGMWVHPHKPPRIQVWANMYLCNDCFLKYFHSDFHKRLT